MGESIIEFEQDFPAADVFAFHHGAVMYELRDMFEAGELENDVEQLRSESTSIFRDRKGHAGQIAIDTGALFGSMPFMSGPFDNA